MAVTSAGTEPGSSKKQFKNSHKRSEAGRGSIPLRKIEVLCSDDVADSRLRTVGLIVRLPKTSVAT